MAFYLKNIIANKPLYQNTILFVLCMVLYNFRILIRFYYSHTFFNDFEYAVLAITYQKCGFISRGLMPSIYEAVGLNNKFLLFLLSNLYIAITTFCVLQIGKYYKNIFFSIAVLLSSFGILHQTTLLLKPDQVVYMLFFVACLCLIKGHTKCFFFISLMSILVHEVSVFLFIPVYFLHRKDNFSFYVYSFIMILLFVLIGVYSTKISENKCINLMKNFTGLDFIPKEYYFQRLLSISNNVKFYFTTYNLALSSILLIFLLIFNYLIFKINYEYRNSILNYLFLFPLILCLFAVDWMRWISMVYILSMLFFNIKKNIDKRILLKLISISLLIGIPNTVGLLFSPLMLVLKLFFLSIFTLVH